MMSEVQGADTGWESLTAYRKAAKESLSRLSLVKPGPEGQLMTLLCVARNEADILPAFLTHYRSLGVKRFVIIDNNSSDDSAEILSCADDVELFWTDAKYADNNGGRFWIDGLAFEKYLNSWLLVVDADEQLVYSDCFERPLPELISLLLKKGLTKLFAPMVDLYPLDDGAVYFDKAPDLISYWGMGPQVHGGPRYRMASRFNLSTRPCLTKYPLVFYDQGTAFVNSHFPLPYATNGSECFARLLHTKLGSRFSGKVRSAIEEGQHWKNSIEYHDYAQWLTEDLRNATSSPCKGPDDLTAAEMMKPIPWRDFETIPDIRNNIPFASILALMHLQLQQERAAHSDTRRALNDFRKDFDESSRTAADLNARRFETLSAKIDQLAERQPSISDMAREVWFERQRWSLAYKISKWLKSR